jgi:hypothetical protein
MILEHRYITTFHLKVLLLRSSSFSVCLQVRMFFFALFASALLCVKSRPSLVVHLGYATFYRMWWLFPTIGLCGVLEIVGWSGRLWSSFSPLLGGPFKIQSVFQFFIHLLTIRLMGILVLELLQPSWDQRHY